MKAAGCTTGWKNYANEPNQAAPEQVSQDVYDAIALTHAARPADVVQTSHSLVKI